MSDTPYQVIAVPSGIAKRRPCEGSRDGPWEHMDRRSYQQGIAFIEAALTLPVFLFLFLLLYDFTNLYLSYSLLTQVAREAVMLGGRTPDLEETSAAAGFANVGGDAAGAASISATYPNMGMVHQRILELVDAYSAKYALNLAAAGRTYSLYHGTESMTLSPTSVSPNEVRVVLQASYRPLLPFLSRFISPQMKVEAVGPYLYAPGSASTGTTSTSRTTTSSVTTTSSITTSTSISTTITTTTASTTATSTATTTATTTATSTETTTATTTGTTTLTTSASVTSTSAAAATPVPPTATSTNTPTPTEAPTSTPTNTPLPPTSTPTNTPLPPTATPTATPACVPDTCSRNGFNDCGCSGCLPERCTSMYGGDGCSGSLSCCVPMTCGDYMEFFPGPGYTGCKQRVDGCGGRITCCCANPSGYNIC